MLIYFFSYCVGKKALNAGSFSNTSCSSHKKCKQFSLSAAAVAMNEIMKTQVHLALQNRNMPAPSQPEPTTAIVAPAERSKAEKLQDAMDAEAMRRSQQQIHDDRKRKFNSLDGDAKEVTGDGSTANLHPLKPFLAIDFV
jgi:hypothetical protein